MKITVLGSGDAFGSGGRLQTSLHLAANGNEVLVDCGATAVIGLQRAGIDPNGISAVLLTHLHGDHFAGLVWFLLHAQHVAKRTKPLIIVGPRGTRERLAIAAEALFPGTTLKPAGFAIEFYEHVETAPLDVSGFEVAAFQVVHTSGAPPYALRISCQGAVMTFSGDTQWTNSLYAASADADVFICECYGFQGQTPGHISWQTLSQKMPEITAKRVYLTHMGPEMLANTASIDHPRVGFSEDGLVLTIDGTAASQAVRHETSATLED